ncbi:MAG: c-type cytochrome biogenesis protein CcmI [Thiobacillus sp.]|nr:c-type cytochrome biogenesis protein CcmI [Thiobacillus sp.]
MNPFWTVSLFWGSAVVCVLIALAFVLPTLLRTRARTTQAARRDVNIAVYRDQLKEMDADRANGLLSEAQYEAAKLELEARLADDALVADDNPEPARASSRRLGFALGTLLPAAAFGMYFWLGNPASLIAVADANAGAAQSDAAGSAAQHDFMKLIEKVEEKTRTSPEDGEAWSMLAKSYAVVERWPEALQAYEKANQLLPQDASVMSGYAEAIAINNNRVLTGRPMELVQKALEINPDDMKGLELSGIYAFQEKNFAQASYFFKKLHKLMPPESAYAQDILAAQQEAERLMKSGLSGLDDLSNPPPAEEKAAAVTAGAAIKGSIDIAPTLKSKIAASDVLFLFARAGQGGPPVAAIRAGAGKFPLEFELNDSMAMNPANTLSQQKQVMLVARVSKSGNPMGQAGDLEGTVTAVKVGASGVKVVIDQVKQ